MTALQLLVYALAIKYLVNLFQNEDGPFDLSLILREFVGSMSSERRILNSLSTFFKELYECFKCMGTWVGIGVLSAAYFYPPVVWLLATVELATILDDFYPTLSGALYSYAKKNA